VGAWDDRAGHSRGLPQQRNSPNLNPDGPPVQRWPLGDERHQPGTIATVVPGGQIAAGPQILGDDATALAISATVQPIESDPGADAQPQLVLVVSWGQGGATHRAEIDIGNGVVVSFWASAIQLAYRDDDPAPGPGQVKNPIRIAGSLSYLQQVGRPARLTRRVLALAPAGLIVLPVPAFASDLLIETSVAGGTVLVELLTLTSVVVSAVAGVAPLGPIPLPNGTRLARLTNTAAVAQDLSAIFGLSF